MSRVGRYAKATAKPGQGHALADALLEVAAILEGAAGCELYIVNRSLDEPDVVWATEVWCSQADLEASLELDAIKPLFPRVMELLEGRPERIDLVPLGGVGL